MSDRLADAELDRHKILRALEKARAHSDGTRIPLRDFMKSWRAFTKEHDR